MGIEEDYLAVLETTRQMASAAAAQDWQTLAEYERQRAEQLATLTPVAQIPAHHDPALTQRLTQRISAIVGQIEAEDGRILEEAEVWLKQVSDLLRLDQTKVT